MKLIIQEYVNREVYDTQEFYGDTFNDVTVKLVENLFDTSTVEYTASVLTKWFGGQHFADSSPGDEKPFDVREYDRGIGQWTDYLFRL